METLTTTINGVDIELEEQCPKCAGRGWWRPDQVGGSYRITCDQCAGKGKVYKYWTPEQIQKLTGNPWAGACWYLNGLDPELGDRLQTGPPPTSKVCFFKDQPAPPADYKPEE